MRRAATATLWDLRMIFGSRRVYPRGPVAWFRWRLIGAVAARRVR